jgi:hypothetical protein
MNCDGCGSTDLEWTADGAHARCRRCPSLFTRDGAGLRRVVVEAPGGGYNPAFQAIFEENLGFTPRAGSFDGPSMGGGAAPGNPLQRTIQLMVVAFVGFIFLAVGAYVAWILYASLPH